MPWTHSAPKTLTPAPNLPASSELCLLPSAQSPPRTAPQLSRQGQGLASSLLSVRPGASLEPRRALACSSEIREARPFHTISFPWSSSSCEGPEYMAPRGKLGLWLTASPLCWVVSVATGWTASQPFPLLATHSNHLGALTSHRIN